MKYTPEQLIKITALIEAEGIDFRNCTTEDDLEETFEEHCDALYEALCEFRNGEVETKLPSQYSRHYECYEVAAQMFNGQWVGWTYWYGGGKHGEPEAIDWMSGAYFLDVTEKEVLQTVRTYTKVE